MEREARSREITNWLTDQILDRTFGDLLSADSYTIIYLSSPAGQSTYDGVDSTGTLSAELKKLRARAWPVRRQDNNTEWDKRPLFEKYQFLTPGSFILDFQERWSVQYVSDTAKGFSTVFWSLS